MDDIAEQQQLAGEITNAISNPIGFDNEVDEVCFYFCSEESSLLSLFAFKGRTIERIDGIRTTNS